MNANFDLFFQAYFERLEIRMNHSMNLNCFSEDSIRYDFFFEACKAFEIESTDIILEQLIPEFQYIRKAKEWPKIDLRIDPKNKLKQGILTEFAFFRKQSSNNQPMPAKHGKLINDLVRLSLMKNFTNRENLVFCQDFSQYKCLLICVSDEEMINYGSGNQGPKAIPISKKYRIDSNFYSSLTKTAQDKIEDRFFQKARENNIIPKASLIYTRKSKFDADNKPWVLWVWEVSFDHNNTKSSI